MNVGILGGTFDPIHLGHVAAARMASSQLRLDQVWLVPTGTPPHRPAPRASGLDRFAMVSLATQDAPSLVPSSVELERSGPSYTVDTIARLRGIRPGALLHLIVGSDTLPEMRSWKDLERLVSMCRVAVVVRPSAPCMGRDLPAWADPVEGMGLDVSATRVRAAVAEGGRLDGLLADAVARHIRKRGLYR